MVDQGILNSNVSIEEEIYNFEKSLKDDGSDWTGFPQIDLKEDSQCIYICGISETDRWHLFYYTLTKIKPVTPIASLAYYRVRDNLIFSKHSQWMKLQMGYTEYDLIFLDGVQFLGEADQRVQEYWMQRFKESKKRNKLFIVYSDCLPEDLKNMPESVVEFFESGIVVQLKSSKG